MEDPEAALGYLLFVIILCLGIFWLVKQIRRDDEKRRKDLTPTRYPQGFTCTRQINAWHIDDTHQKDCVLMADGKSTTTFAFSQIKDVQVIQNMQSRQSGSPVTRAIVGGILAGGVGAIIGGISGSSDKDFCVDLRMRVTLINDKIIDEIFIKAPTKLSSLTYSLASTNCKRYYEIFSDIFLLGHPEIKEKMQKNENGIHEDLTKGL